MVKSFYDLFCSLVKIGNTKNNLTVDSVSLGPSKIDTIIQNVSSIYNSILSHYHRL